MAHLVAGRPIPPLRGGTVGAFCATIVAMGLTGCATVPTNPYFSSVRSAANVYVAPVRADVVKIAVLPFKAPTELIGASVADMVVTEMLKLGRYTLVERSQMAGVLSETELAMAGLSERRAMEVGRMLGADGVVIGTVDEYSTQARGGRTHAVVGLSIRLIHSQTGQILWSADLAKMAEDPNVPLAAHGRAVVHELIAGLYQRLGAQRSTPAPGTAMGAPVPASAPAAPAPPPPPPPPPSDLKASDLGLREVTLTWSVPREAISAYRIERAESLQGPFVKIAEVSPLRGMYTDRDGLKDSSTYYYRIIAVAGPGRLSEPSRPVESMTAPPPDPPPTVSAVATGSRAVTLTWTAPRAEGIVRYRIERALAADLQRQWVPRGETTGTTLVDGGRPGTDLLDSTEYLYRVASINRVGAVGPPSEPVRVMTLPPPAPIADLRAASDEVRCVPLRWTASPEGDVTGYEIERRAPGEDAFRLLVTVQGRLSTNHLDGLRDPGNLKDEACYIYRIRPFNAVGSRGAWSPPVEAVTRAPPPAPQSVSARSGLPRAVEVAWAASPDLKVTGYRIERGEGETGPFVLVGQVSGLTTTQFLDRAGASRSSPVGHLKDGTRYRYRVSAFNTANAASPWSETVLATTKPAPSVPTGLTATTNRPKSVALAWAPNPEPDIVRYVVESRAADSSRWREVISTSGTVAVHAGLNDGEVRYYRLRAVDRDTLESAASAEARGAARPLPPAPESLAAEWTAEGARLSWEGRPGMKEYRLYRKGFLSSERLLAVAGPPALLPAAVVGKGLTVVVTAVDEEDLESRPSAAIKIRPPAAPR
ncbi:MAG: fibronectin type III domain-containing protein [Kiritimatiellae bacterium]|nr:fibronectin type III domain-containing protein [Kiritimatiellia bacterium]